MSEIDVHHFKVICQTCGKTGEVDFDKPQREMGWMLRFGHEPGCEDFEYNQCIDCFDKEDKDERKME